MSNTDTVNKFKLENKRLGNKNEAHLWQACIPEANRPNSFGEEKRQRREALIEANDGLEEEYVVQEAVESYDIRH